MLVGNSCTRPELTPRTRGPGGGTLQIRTEAGIIGIIRLSAGGADEKRRHLGSPSAPDLACRQVDHSYAA